MDGTAIKAMMAELAPVIRDYIDETLSPVVARLTAIEEGKCEKFLTINAAGTVKAARETAEQVIAAAREKQGERGIGIASTEKRDGVLILRLTDGTEHQVADGEPGNPGQDGVSPDPEVIAAAFRETAEKIVADAIEAGLADLPPPEKGDPGQPGEPGKDGCGIADLLVDRDGSLVASFDDGRMKNLGQIVGKPGEPGKDGRDGFDLEAFDVGVIDERTIELKFTGAGQVHRYELEFPVIVDRGVFKAGESYKRGDAVTWGGSLWIAQMETGVKPDTADSGWRLAVRKGRDGKDAKVA